LRGKEAGGRAFFLLGVKLPILPTPSFFHLLSVCGLVFTSDCEHLDFRDEGNIRLIEKCGAVPSILAKTLSPMGLGWRGIGALSDYIFIINCHGSRDSSTVILYSFGGSTPDRCLTK
jgi:hypothetical protein